MKEVKMKQPLEQPMSSNLINLTKREAFL